MLTTLIMHWLQSTGDFSNRKTMLKSVSTNYGRNKHQVEELNAKGVPEAFTTSAISVCW